MSRRLLYQSLVIVLAFPLPSALQAQEEPLAPREESAPETSATTAIPTPQAPEQVLPDLLPEEQTDPLILLGELRGALRTSPERVDDRLKLAQVLYQIGDLDAALDECRAALALAPQSAKGHIQLGILFMAKQDWRGAAAAMKEAVRLDPGLAQGHYHLGTVQYSLGNPKAAMQSYRRALELQPYFPDARYRLALVLKLTNQHQEAARLMEEAALGGVAQAQFFIGNAYQQGAGVAKDLARAIYWWTKAAESGQSRAAEALSQLRRQALAPDPNNRRGSQAREAFQRYREELSAHDQPDAVTADTPPDSLLRTDRPDLNGVALLLAEAYALSEPAHHELARLYGSGLDGRLAPFDPRILKYLEVMAADGFAPAKRSLAQVYGRGLGVPRDRQKAKALLKGLPKQEIKAILDEMSAP
jgi:TPR repeat protein